MTAEPARPGGESQRQSAADQHAERSHPHHHAVVDPTGRKLAVLGLTALGVVYGDIGTSPLYAIKECFSPHYGLVPSAANVYGVLSLIVWSLLLVVTLKYVGFILRADNRGEGGVLALLALVLQREHRKSEQRRRLILTTLGLFGGAFLYGDGIITPAISVLGALEGLEVAAPALGRIVVPLALLIIAALFSVQYKGTAAVGGLFGWLMLVWFGTIGTLGVMEIARDPAILAAVNPLHAVRFFVDHPQRSFVVLGAVVLVITGGEALYADMGHFGRRPIRLAWFALVLPCLLLNYFGQGALLLRIPEAVTNPFYRLAPGGFVYPLLGVATLAAIVASQALISGAFSLTQQAVQLGYSPRMQIVHTSDEQAGQIYIPEVNKALAVGTLLLVVTFRSSTALGAAYGVAVERDDGHHVVPVRAHRRAALRVVEAQDAALPGVLPHDRRGVLPRQRAQGAARRLGAARRRRAGLPAHDHVEGGPRHAAGQARRERAPDGRLPRRRRAAPAAARARHRRCS
jgi:KUP system potassium uptake protein